MQNAIKDDLEIDIRNSAKCGFDALLKYFLSIVLEAHHPKKSCLNEIQIEIEKLQSKRYYGDLDGNGDTATRVGASGTSVAAAESVGTQRAATGGREDTSDTKNVDPDDDTQFGSEEEKRLVKERDEILDGLLHDALEAVLPIANNKDVKENLMAFAKQFENLESARYKPYVLLCNNALDRLASVGANLRVRKPDELNIRFHRNDPNVDVIDYKLDRKPDIIITSLHAALDVARSTGKQEVNETFSEKPHKIFKWPTILSCGQFKVLKHRIPEEGNIMNLQKPFDIVNPPQVLRHAFLSAVDSNDVMEAPIVVKGSGSKRARDGESVAENPSLSKKPGQLDPETSSGSNFNSNNSPATNSANSQANLIEKYTREVVNGRMQCASYAMEMLSYSVGVHHAINLLFTDGHLWISYYDRQGIVQSDGVSIFADFPRFLVLLFAFQRFTREDWGIIPCLNPNALHGHGNQPETEKQSQGERAREKGGPDELPVPPPVPSPVPGVSLDLQQHLPEFWAYDGPNNVARVEVDMDNFLSHQPHCIAGRATSVVSAQGFAQDGTSVPTPMVCKIYHPEVQHRHEGLTLRVVRQIAKDNDQEMLRHLPSMLFYGDVPGCTTQRIRSMTKRKWKGHCTLRILGLKKLEKITSVEGAEFIQAWLETVICHSFLWKHYVEHGDPSLSNIMYDPDTKCGVLSDFDLSLLQWEPRITGTDRTGTVPFMALRLLTEDYWEGKTQRFFHHELESFIWILAYVALLYEKGIRQTNPDVDAWRTSNYINCRQKKQVFYTGYTLMTVKDKTQPSYRVYWPLVQDLCLKLHRFHYNSDERLFNAPTVDGPVVDASLEDSQELWDTFIAVLGSKLQNKDLPGLTRLLDCLRAQKPSFRAPDLATQEQLQQKYCTIFDRDQVKSALGQ